MKPDFLDEVGPKQVDRGSVVGNPAPDNKIEEYVYRFSESVDPVKWVIKMGPKVDYDKMCSEGRNKLLKIYDLNYLPFYKDRHQHDKDTDSLFKILKNPNAFYQSTNIISSLPIQNPTKLDEIIVNGDIQLNKLWCVYSITGEYGIIYNILSVNDVTMWFSLLRYWIPVRIVGENEMPRPNSVCNNSTDDEIISMETFGVYKPIEDARNYFKIKDDVYHSCSKGNINSLLEICICKERIEKFIEEHKKDGYKYDDIFIIVYLHELAHAALDQMITIKQNEYGEKNHTERDINNDNAFYPMTASCSNAMEESLANMIMLKYLSLDPTESDLFKKAEGFIQKFQPEEYKFGLDQFAANVDWTKWREYKANHQEADDKLKQWYKDFFENNNKQYTKEDFDKIFV